MLTVTFHEHHGNKSTAAAQLTPVRGVEYVSNIWFEAAGWSVQLKSPPPFTTSFHVILLSTNSQMEKNGMTAV